MPRGGQRRPRNPAPVSGPGALSRRTDGGPANPILDAPSPQYGAGVQLQNQVAAAPLAQGPGGPPAAAEPSMGPGDMRAVLGDLYAPTQRPDEPVTAGIPYGPGAPGTPMLPDDPDEWLRAALMASQGNPDIAALLRTRR